jgi:RNA-directed DNA polymerase
MVIKKQLRMLEAYLKKDYDEVEKRELHLIQSYAARALAVKRVTSNTGSETPGVDNVSYQSDESKLQAVKSLKDALPGKYQAKPVKRVMIEKPGSPGTLRPLGIPTVYDRCVQALYSLALEPIAKHTADPNSYGFQEGIGTWDAISKLELILISKPYPKMVYEGDIKGFFDNISHS